MKMRKSLVITLLVLVGVAMPSVAAAQDCQYHNLKLDFKSFRLIDPIGSYDRCLEVSKVVGTLNGSYIACWHFDEYIPSSEIFGDDVDNIVAEKYYSWISTKKGDLEFIEWAWFDEEFGLENGFAKVTGGTGDFEGAFGSLSYTPRFPNLGPVVWFEGYICTP
jgi:hypothetical protein